MSLAGRLTGIQSPPERQITRQLVQNMLLAEPDWDIPEIRTLEQGRELVCKLVPLDGSGNSFEIQVLAFQGERLLDEQHRIVRRESYRRP